MTFFAVPYRDSGDSRRNQLWRFTRDWLRREHYEIPIYVGAGDGEGPFNRGAAINEAVRKHDDDWNVVIVSDSDNICDPNTLRDAVRIAGQTGKVVYPFEAYIYLDMYSSDQLMNGRALFWSPERHPRECYRTTVRYHHYSGIQVIPRSAWERVGGFVELQGWGAEDAVMNHLFNTFAYGSHFMYGGAYHLWHESNRNDPTDACNVANHIVAQRVERFSTMRQDRQLRNYLLQIGHKTP